ncbi:MAG: hypothetical protein JWQ70_1619 [Aeromicrobium sp.]|nr:hypothetical protein [Aeromicrobium sp.]
MVHRSMLRLVVMAIVGIAVGVISAVTGAGEHSFVLGWAAASFVYSAWVWLVIGRMDSKSTASHAVREDPVHAVAELLILATTVASLAAVALLLIDARSVSDAKSGVFAAMALGSVALSWVLIHTLYTLRYARLYFDASPGGIDFNTGDAPSYIDFAYVAFTLGMTFQVADTDLESTAFRSVALRHALLSYLFGTVVVATTINLAVSLST